MVFSYETKRNTFNILIVVFYAHWRCLQRLLYLFSWWPSYSCINELKSIEFPLIIRSWYLSICNHCNQVFLHPPSQSAAMHSTVQYCTAGTPSLVLQKLQTQQKLCTIRAKTLEEVQFVSLYASSNLFDAEVGSNSLPGDQSCTSHTF